MAPAWQAHCANLPDFQDAVRPAVRMAMAPNGQAMAHFAQPVQPPASCSTADFSQPRGSSHSTCGGQTATQRPQPVQRAGSTTGRALRGDAMGPC